MISSIALLHPVAQVALVVVIGIIAVAFIIVFLLTI